MLLMEPLLLERSELLEGKAPPCYLCMAGAVDASRMCAENKCGQWPPGLPLGHKLRFQSSHPLSPPSPSVLNLSQP